MQALEKPRGGKSRQRITPDQVKRIEELLRKRKTTKQIVDDVGVGTSTISLIRRGNHPMQEGRSEMSEYERCPGCGGKVKMPCRVCLMKGSR